ncbi:PEGA domain-containing protein [Pseudoalteromonas sp. MMG006]|uniref:PEGA domain-containing protein n=1 Tax=Pseudoalteromonas sp. MMG006 TaxID=2822683 RepID=UPI001B368735|nr:PEGA domain-containing protein [Pseudoalteromonas sp. MMG006]MBQ4800065.1 PEGA domain-containing protein [Pseudoalteromonas sp. MMG006]
MKKISTLATLLLLSGCSTTSSVDKMQQMTKEEAVQIQEKTVEAVAPVSLTVITNPRDARVRIMNIKPVYEDAIVLDEGKYDVEVSKSGYLTYRKWVVVDKKTILTINLDEVAATEAAN